MKGTAGQMSDRGRLKWLKTEKLFSKMVLKNLKAVNFVVWHVITKYFM